MGRNRVHPVQIISRLASRLDLNLALEGGTDASSWRAREAPAARAKVSWCGNACQLTPVHVNKKKQTVGYFLWVKRSSRFPQASDRAGSLR